jgi:hypothetical protein
MRTAAGCGEGFPLHVAGRFGNGREVQLQRLLRMFLVHAIPFAKHFVNRRMAAFRAAKAFFPATMMSSS